MFHHTITDRVFITLESIETLRKKFNRLYWGLTIFNIGLTLLFAPFSVTADTKVHPAGNSAQSAFLGQVLTHSIHKIHSVPFSGVIGHINIHRTNFFTFSTWNTLLFVTLNSGCREIAHRFQKNCDRTNILTKRSVIFESECQNNPHNIIQFIGVCETPQHRINTAFFVT